MKLTNSKPFPTLFAFLVVVFIVSGCIPEETRVILSANLDDPVVEFAVNELTEAFREMNIEVQLSSPEKAGIIFSIQPGYSNLKPEGFSIEKDAEVLKVIGTDAAGLMYGGLKLAEQVRIHGLEGSGGNKAESIYGTPRHQIQYPP